MESLPTDILAELIPTAIMSFSALDLNINEEFELQLTDEVVFQCQKVGKYELLINKDSLLNTLDIDKDDPMLNVLTNPANHRILSKSEKFKHPLTEVSEAELGNGIEPVMNGYAIATVIIDCIRNPEKTNNNGESAKDFFRRTVLESGKAVNVEVLLEKIKAGHLAEMMEASTLINDGFHNIAHAS